MAISCVFPGIVLHSQGEELVGGPWVVAGVSPGSVQLLCGQTGNPTDGTRVSVKEGTCRKKLDTRPRVWVNLST